MKLPPSLQRKVAVCGIVTAFACAPAYSITTIPTLVDLELSLVVDVSGSVSGTSYTLQMEGYASAFESTALQSAISSTTNGIAVNLIQFSSSAQESIAWTFLNDASSANAFATEVRNAVRLFSGGTNIDSGINTAVTSMANNNFNGTRSVIDVSGDGQGTANGTSRDNALASGVNTINGIVIGADPNGSLRQFYENNVAGGQGSFVAVAPSFQDFQPEVLRKISREVTGISNDGFPVAAALRQTQLSLVHAGLNDVNSRLFRMRTRRPEAAPAPVIPSSAKGSYSAKDAKSPIVMPPTPKRWEAYGSLHYYNEQVDGSNLLIPGSNLRIPILPDYEIDIYGGTVGIEYTLNQNWAFGAALIGNNADVDMGQYGDIDTDGYALALYASYFQRNAFGGPGDWYADLLVSYAGYENDIKRNTFAGTAKGNTDSDSYTVQLSTGYNITSGNWIHGPIASLRYTDGDIDGFTETGAGAATFPSMEFESLLSRVGYQVSRVIDTSRGAIIPQFRAAWEHEFENDPATIASLPLGVTDDDRIVLGAGVAWEFSENGRVILNYEGRFASDLESHQIGIRLGFKF